MHNWHRLSLRKLSFTREKAYAFGRTLIDQTEVLPLDEETLDRAAAVAIRYQLSHWDALIVARHDAQEGGNSALSAFMGSLNCAADKRTFVREVVSIVG